MFGSSRHLLLLAGVLEARALAEAIAADLALRRRWRVTASLSGELAKRRGESAFPAEMVRGGFAGAEGMTTALKWDRIDLVLDASHPFSPEISDQAHAACAAVSAPLCRFSRPAWAPEAGDQWRVVPTLAAAARAAPLFSRVFLLDGAPEGETPPDAPRWRAGDPLAGMLARDAIRATGPSRMSSSPAQAEAFAAFRDRRDLWVLARAHDPTARRFPLPRGDYALGRPPFAEAHERMLLMDYRIGVVIAQNAGGEFGRPTLAAARRLGLPVIMVERPAPPSRQVMEVSAITEALEWLRRRLA
ncbi:MAG: precorrin-6A/cobalt-precorrin-6A reductase [Rhodobacteraceae bacterium]|nr:precorrin-6A/cobalt-precorrin-6A reductase [Paracoccaceae bacterium]